MGDAEGDERRTVGGRKVESITADGRLEERERSTQRETMKLE